MSIPQMNLPVGGMPWGRWVQNAIQGIQNTLARMGQDAGNATARNGSALNALGQQIVNLNTKVQNAFNSLTVAPSQVTPGTFGAGVILPSSQLSGDISVANVTGTATVTSAAVTGTNVYATQGPTQNITATRVAGWLQSSNGLIGTASSSLRYKTNIINATTDPEKLLAIVVHYYNYIAEVAKRDDPTSPDYVGPDYHVHQEIGGIAEEFHAAGLWEFVVYQRNEDGTLALDASGQPVPDGLHYELIGLGALIAAQHVNNKLNDLAARVAKLDGGPTTA